MRSSADGSAEISLVTDDEETNIVVLPSPKKKRLGGIRFKEPTPMKKPINK